MQTPSPQGAQGGREGPDGWKEAEEEAEAGVPLAAQSLPSPGPLEQPRSPEPLMGWRGQTLSLVPGTLGKVKGMGAWGYVSYLAGKGPGP